MKSLVSITTCIAVSALLAACGDKDDKKAKIPPPLVDVIITQQQAITNNIEVNGSVMANQSVLLHPEVAGRVTFLNVPEGKEIKKGTIIARINSQDLAAQLSKSKVQLALARETQDRLKKLLAINGVNQADYDAAKNATQGLEADVNYYQALIDKTIVKAPFSGLVGLRKVSVGAFIATTDVIASLQQLDSLMVDFTLPNEYGSVLHKGDTVTILVDGIDQKKRTAKIIAIEPQVNTSTRNLEVRALIGNRVANIGAFAKVYVDAGTDKNAILVPTSAIIPDDQSNKVVVARGGKSVYVNVQTGVRQANNIEITKGLKEGDSVVVRGTLFTHPNGPVKVKSVMTLESVAN